MSWARGGARLSPTRGGQLGRLRQSRGVLRRAEDTIPEHPLALPGRGGAVHPLTCLGRCEGPLLLVWEEEDVWWPGRSRGGETGHLAGAPSLSLTCWGPPAQLPRRATGPAHQSTGPSALPTQLRSQVPAALPTSRRLFPGLPTSSSWRLGPKSPLSPAHPNQGQ